MMKAQFMSFWDGLITDNSCTVIIMGATNRPQDLDKAILRRMPATFLIPLPNTEQRKRILELILKDELIDENVDIKRIALNTEGFSGSDLRELCRNASIYRVRNYMKSAKKKIDEAQASCADDSEDEYHDVLWPITMDDILISLNKMKDSKMHCIGGLPARIDLD